MMGQLAQLSQSSVSGGGHRAADHRPKSKLSRDHNYPDVPA